MLTKKCLRKKGQFLNGAVSFLLAIITIGLILSVGGLVTGQIEENNCDGVYNSSSPVICQDGAAVSNATNTSYVVNASRSLAFNVSVSATDGFSGYGQLFPTVGIVVVATVILSLVAAGFMGSGIRFK